MKNKLIFGLLLLTISVQAFSQAPQAIKYQAVARDTDGNLLNGQNISVRFIITGNAPNGTVFYSETHNVLTNEFGLFTINIGLGTPEQGSFSDIPWGNGTYFLSVETDIGSGYFSAGNMQMLSVPYAINAGSLTLTSEDGTHYNITVDNDGNLSTQEVVIDQDGNVYPTVRIGNQVWMAKNLNVGSMIHCETGGSNGDGEPTDNGIIEKYCYENDEAWCDSLGGLYKWYELMDYVQTEGTQGICPDGWHIPTENEWLELIDQFPEDSAGYYLQPAGGSGFNGLMSGYWFQDHFSIHPTCIDNPCSAAFWSSSFPSENVTVVRLSTNSPSTTMFWLLPDDVIKYGLQVRCIKNNSNQKTK